MALLLQFINHRQSISLDKADAVVACVAVLHAVAFPALGIHVVNVPSRSRMCPRDVVPGVACREGDRPTATDAPACSVPTITSSDVDAEHPVEYFPCPAHASGKYCGNNSDLI